MKGVIWAIIICAVVLSCKSATKFSDTYDFANSKWKENESIAFEFIPTSTQKSGNITVGLRHHRELCDSTIELIITTKRPKLQLVNTDTISIHLTPNSGKRIFSTTFIYRSEIEWQSMEKHTISIKSPKTLDGTMNLSVEIENARIE